MTREELRDQLLASVLQWTRLGRQSSRLMTATTAVVSYRSRRLLRTGAMSRQADWDEVALMAREKVEVPLESATAMVSAMVPAAHQFWTHAGQSMMACTSDTLALASSRSAEDFRERQAALCATWANASVGWFRLFGTVAEIAGQGVSPVLRQVEANAERLARR